MSISAKHLSKQRRSLVVLLYGTTGGKLTLQHGNSDFGTIGNSGLSVFLGQFFIVSRTPNVLRG